MTGRPLSIVPLPEMTVGSEARRALGGSGHAAIDQGRRETCSTFPESRNSGFEAGTKPIWWAVRGSPDPAPWRTEGLPFSFAARFRDSFLAFHPIQFRRGVQVD